MAAFLGFIVPSFEAVGGAGKMFYFWAVVHAIMAAGFFLYSGRSGVKPVVRVKTT